MIYGQAGWSDGGALLARRAVGAGMMWRPGFCDDFLGFGVTVADPSDRTLNQQTKAEAFFRFDVSDKFAITADVQYLNEPGFKDQDPWVLGLQARLNL